MSIRSLFAVTMTVVLATPAPAASNEDVIERCRDTGSDADRIACLEAAILSGAGEEGRETPTAIAPRAAGEAGTEVPGAARSREVGEGDNETLTPVQSREAGEKDDIVEMGAEQVAARNRTRESMTDGLLEASNLEVEKFETVGYRKLQIHLKNGQIWRQIRGDTQQIRVSLERNPTVTIRESSLGGYRMRLDGIRRIIRVQRIR